MMLSLAAAFAQAEVAAPGIDKQDFLDQAREHLISGRLKATGFPCAVTLDVATLEFEYFELQPNKRQEIPQIEWVDLRLSMHWGGMATFGNPDQSPVRQIATRHEGDFAVSLYSDVVLMADSFTGLWTAGVALDDLLRAEANQTVDGKVAVRRAEKIAREHSFLDKRGELDERLTRLNIKGKQGRKAAAK